MVVGVGWWCTGGDVWGDGSAFGYRGYSAQVVAHQILFAGVALGAVIRAKVPLFDQAILHILP